MYVASSYPEEKKEGNCCYLREKRARKKLKQADTEVGE